MSDDSFSDEDLAILSELGVDPFDYTDWHDYYESAQLILLDYWRNLLFTPEELELLLNADVSYEDFSSNQEWLQAARDYLDSLNRDDT